MVVPRFLTAVLVAFSIHFATNVFYLCTAAIKTETVERYKAEGDYQQHPG